MSFLSQNRRHHIMSPAAQDIASKALAQLADVKNAAAAAADALSTTASQEKTGLQSGRVTFASATELGFKPVGFDLYSLASDDAFLPTIWKKDTVIDPVTGKKTEWLVAYTTDDDDIVRSTAATWQETNTVNVPQQKVHRGDRIQDPETGRQGVVTSLQWFETGAYKHWVLHVRWDGDTQDTEADYNAVQPLAAQAVQKTASMSPELRTAADAPPKKNTPPIAPGIVTKNLTLDQTGQGGTAKVTVDFNDPQKGEEFFKQVEELAGGVGGGETAPAEKPAEAPAEGPPPEGAPEGGPPAGGGAPPTPKPQMPTPVPAAAPMASTIKNLTHFGSKIVYLTMEKYATFSPVYSYVNEDGQCVEIELPGCPKVGSTIRRPDTGENIRVGGVSVVEAAADDEAILSHLLATAVDISDQVPPMGWTNKESQNEEGEGGNKPLPPNPALQQGAPPTADTAAPPLYDSQTAPDAGEKQKFNMSVNPNDNSVTVKFEKSPALDAIDQAVQGQQPPMGGQQPSPAPSAQGLPAGQQPPLNGQPKDEFNQSESPTQF